MKKTCECFGSFDYNMKEEVKSAYLIGSQEKNLYILLDYPGGTPRKLVACSTESLANLIEETRPARDVKKVGHFEAINLPIKEVKAIAKLKGVDILMVHSAYIRPWTLRDDEYPLELKFQVIKP